MYISPPYNRIQLLSPVEEEISDKEKIYQPRDEPFDSQQKKLKGKQESSHDDIEAWLAKKVRLKENDIKLKKIRIDE